MKFITGPATAINMRCQRGLVLKLPLSRACTPTGNASLPGVMYPKTEGAAATFVSVGEVWIISISVSPVILT